MPSGCKSDSRAPHMVVLTPAQITDLPPELLHDICSEFDTRALVRLSHTCRRLLHVTWPLIFKHQIAHLQFWMDSGYLVTAPRMEMKGLVQFEDIRLDYLL
ncbi:hypothetical protein BDZ94DRAFT_1271060 [Collybia nuda]|uniref:F-box domain-containing protein n=1 Tax=Collybia nuda TaxID=64659 RepID=A0A9P6CES3_9AGAR|nr:hypothetical protein BDZ94DRAFT_1271060 [Collybia nuda]